MLSTRSPGWTSRSSPSECSAIQATTASPPLQAVLHTNLIAAVSAITWLGDYFAQRHAGTLAVLSSVAGDRGRKSNYIYGSSKAGSRCSLTACATRSTAKACA